MLEIHQPEASEHCEQPQPIHSCCRWGMPYLSPVGFIIVDISCTLPWWRSFVIMLITTSTFLNEELHSYWFSSFVWNVEKYLSITIHLIIYQNTIVYLYQNTIVCLYQNTIVCLYQNTIVCLYQNTIVVYICSIK